MKKLLTVLLAAAILLSGCAKTPEYEVAHAWGVRDDTVAVTDKEDAKALDELIRAVMESPVGEEGNWRFNSMSLWVPVARICSGDVTYTFEMGRMAMGVTAGEERSVLESEWYACTEEQLEAVAEIAARYPLGEDE